MKDEYLHLPVRVDEQKNHTTFYYSDGCGFCIYNAKFPNVKCKTEWIKPKGGIE